MGVRGLTTYIAKNAEKYLEPHELHDCNLVIDGDSLASNLYRWSPSCSSAFGGNYDHYYRIVCNFFAMLQQCNVTAYVVLDGGYQRRKLRTMQSRLRSKVSTIKYLNPSSFKPIFPIMMREVFVEAIEHCGVHMMRCVFEADDEVAVLARKLNCPVLSYDSDFYIHNVQYIPSITLTMKVYRRLKVTATGDGRPGNRRKTMVQELLDDGHGLKTKTPSKQNDASEQCYYYMDCCMYTINNLVEKRGLNDEMLPLFAVLLGNDYIKISIFSKFYRNVSLKGCGKKNSQQGKRIVAILHWLKNQTVESAVTSILSRVPKDRRQWLQNQIESAMSGYSTEESRSFTFFGFEKQRVTPSQSALKMLMNNVAQRDDAASDSDVESTGSIESDEEEDSDQCDDNEDDVDAAGSDEQVDSGVPTSKANKANTIDDDCNSSDHSNDEYCDKSVYDSYTPPAWIESKWLHAKLPRFVIDLLHLRLYVNAPQVENFLLPDAHEIALSILRLIFTILHYPRRPVLRYLTRVQRIAQIHYKRLECLDEGTCTFDSAKAANLSTFSVAFKDFDNFDEICHAINTELPSEYRLFALSLIFWAKHSKHVDAIHISSVILSAIVLGLIDKRIEPLRSRDKFQQKYQAQLHTTGKKRNEAKEPECGDVEAEATKQDVARVVDTPTATLETLISTINKLECIHAQNNLLVHFDLSDKMRKRHTENSSTILHAYAELQAIVFQLNCLNTLCSHPFANASISNFYNGSFLYNIYVALKDRPEVPYYLEKFIFAESPTLWAIYLKFITILTPFIGCLATSNDAVPRKKKNRTARKNRLRKEKRAAAAAERCSDEAETVNASDSDFEDLNNKFACLLNVNK